MDLNVPPPKIFALVRQTVLCTSPTFISFNRLSIYNIMFISDHWEIFYLKEGGFI